MCCGRFETLETSNCVVCGSPATLHTGYVRLHNDEETQVTAGWCEGCYDENNIKEDGFVGAWEPEYGIAVFTFSEITTHGDVCETVIGGIEE